MKDNEVNDLLANREKGEKAYDLYYN